MRRRSINRSIVALIAAYAIAMQTLLSAGVMLSHAAAAADICDAHNDAGGSSGQPLGQGNDCPCGPACTMSACDAPVGVAADAAVAVVWPTMLGPTLETPSHAHRALMDAVYRSNLPRAPPVA